MICEGVFIDRKLCGRYGSWLAKLARAELRRNGTPIPDDLAKLLTDLDRVGFLDRTSATSDATSASSATAESSGVLGSAACSMTSGQAARTLGVSEQRVRKLIARGDLRAVKRQGNWLLARSDVEEFSYKGAA